MVTVKMQFIANIGVIPGPIHEKQKLPQRPVSSLSAHMNYSVIIFSKRCPKLDKIFKNMFDSGL